MTDGAKDGEVKDLNIDTQLDKKPVNNEVGNVEAEALKKELASRDKKIAELLALEKTRIDEAEAQRLASLSLEEKYNEVQKQLNKQDNLNNYMSLGYTREQALEIVNTESENAKAILIKSYAEQKAVEDFKLKQLANIPKTAEPPKDVLQDDPILEKAKQAVLGY